MSDRHARDDRVEFSDPRKGPDDGNYIDISLRLLDYANEKPSKKLQELLAGAKSPLPGNLVWHWTNVHLESDSAACADRVATIVEILATFATRDVALQVKKE